MRHYYRFMELEPVLELEEDSVGDESPSSSMGSPSLSPPPDVWAQLAGKEYQDSAYNLLLQDHLDLQRSFRLLEVQYRNCEHRAARTINECYAQIQGLKDTLKQLLASQETDKLATLRDDLLRVKDREGKLNEQLFDLREQNELLEFRVLELEECSENASQRSVSRGTRDMGTGMDEASLTPRALATHFLETDRASASGRPTASVSPVPALSASCLRSDRQIAGKIPLDTQPDAEEGAREIVADASHPSSASPSGANRRPVHPEPEEPEQLEEPDDGLWMVEPAAQPPVFIGDAISCNLCRRSPRRCSLNAVRGYGDGDADADAPRVALRKCKSDGEMMKLAGRSDRSDVRLLDQMDGIKRAPGRGGGGGGGGGVREALDAIHGILRETRLEVECTNSELREEVVTLEGALVRLARQAEGREGSDGDLQDFFRQHSCSLSASKECHCCSRELRPALEDVISRMQQLTMLVESHDVSLATLPDAINSSELTSSEMESRPAAEEVSVEGRTGVGEASQAFATATEAPAIRKEIHVWNCMPDTCEDKTTQEESIIRAESDKVVAKIESMKNQIDKFEKSSILHSQLAVISNLDESSTSNQPTTRGSSLLLERSVDENFGSCKPVLRRWREHLNSRDSRANSWAGVSEFQQALKATAAV